jgi:hypothetical protein
MPVFISTPFQGQRSVGGPGEEDKKNLREKNFDSLYRSKYPDEGSVNLRPGTEFHDALVSEILQRGREAEREISKRFPKWDQIDQQLTAYIPQSDAEDLRKSADIRKPTSIVIPESFAILETFVTYMTTVFSDIPMFKYIGTGPEDTIGAILLEKVVDIQVQKKAAMLTLQEQFRDSFAYGVGIVTINWIVEMGKRTAVEDTFRQDPVTGEQILLETNRVEIEDIQYEGSVLQCIDPRKYLPDPNVSIYRPQDAEFLGWLEDGVSYMSLLREEQQPNSFFFNVRYLRGLGGHSSMFAHQTKARNPSNMGEQIDSPPKSQASQVTQTIDKLWMYIDLIPKEWKLGPSTNPEKWLFCLGNDQVIIAASKMDNHHGMYPVGVCSPEAGGHELIPTSRMEMGFGPQEVVNFLVNSHMESTMKHLRNHMVVDPMLVNMKDVQANKGIIRTRQPNWGRGVDGAIKDLRINDATAGHMNDMGMMTQIMRGTLGAVDSAQGIQRIRGERVTKSEFESTKGSALSRMQKAAQTISLQSMQSLGFMYAFHTQQYMSEDVYVRTAGRWEDVLRTEFNISDPQIKVSPFDLAINFDVIPQDGTVAGGEDAQGWIDFLQVVQNLPGMLQSLNSRAIALHIGRLLGNKNPEQFVNPQPVDVQTLPADAVGGAEQQGLVPLDQA